MNGWSGFWLFLAVLVASAAFVFWVHAEYMAVDWCASAPPSAAVWRL